VTPAEIERPLIVLSSVLIYNEMMKKYLIATMGTLGRYFEISLAISPVSVKHTITVILSSKLI